MNYCVKMACKLVLFCVIFKTDYMFNTGCQLLIKILKASYALVGAVYNDIKTSLYSKKKMRTPEGILSAIYLWRETILPPRLAPPPSPAPLTPRHSRG